MYRLLGRCEKDMTPYFQAADKWKVAWNPPGWGSNTDLKLKEIFGDLVEGEWHKSMLVGLKASSLIPLHTDAAYRIKTERVHVVLSTNEGCWQFHDGEWQQLELGGIYAMDETLPHLSVNAGSTVRYHLVVDRLPLGGSG